MHFLKKTIGSLTKNLPSPPRLPSVVQAKRKGASSRQEFYADNGYVIERGGLNASAVANLRKALQKEVIASDALFLRHRGAKREPHSYVHSVTGEPIIVNALLDPHVTPETPLTARAIEKLVCGSEVTNLLTAIDGEGHYTIHQTIVFFTSPGTQMHIDGWALDTLPRGYGHTLWIALESIAFENNPPFLVPWKRGNFLAPEALGQKDFLARLSEKPQEAYRQYHEALSHYMDMQPIEYVVPQLRPADLVVFSSLTPHGTVPQRHHQPRSRLAMQVIVRPTRKNWTWFPGGLMGESNPPDVAEETFSTINKHWRSYLTPEYRKRRNPFHF